MHYLILKEVYILVKFLKMLSHFGGGSIYGELMRSELREGKFASSSFIRYADMLKAVLFWLQWHCQLIIFYSHFIRYEEEVTLYSHLRFFPFPILGSQEEDCKQKDKASERAGGNVL